MNYSKDNDTTENIEYIDKWSQTFRWKNVSPSVDPSGDTIYVPSYVPSVNPSRSPSEQQVGD